MNQLSSILPASDARANFYQILAEASDKLRQFTIKLRGKDDVVILCRRSRGLERNVRNYVPKKTCDQHSSSHKIQKSVLSRPGRQNIKMVKFVYKDEALKQLKRIGPTELKKAKRKFFYWQMTLWRGNRFREISAGFAACVLGH